MPLTIHKTVYVPVSIEERLPDESDFYDCILISEYDEEYEKNLEFSFGAFIFEDEEEATQSKITHWLEPQHEKIVLSKEELHDLMWNKCRDAYDGYASFEKDFESLFK